MCARDNMLRHKIYYYHDRLNNNMSEELNLIKYEHTMRLRPLLKTNKRKRNWVKCRTVDQSKKPSGRSTQTIMGGILRRVTQPHT